jgi:uncharacterized protein GlcG (DUF336 family)
MLKSVLGAALLVLVTALPARADSHGLMSFKLLTPEAALALAEATLADCRDKGYQTAVAVVDRFGILQVLLRDRFAGPHTVEVARRKAWTAVSFRTDTLTMAENTQVGKPQSGVRYVPGALMVGGGVTVESAGSIVAAVGVSGAPGGDLDDACARVGIEAITEMLEF